VTENSFCYRYFSELIRCYIDGDQLDIARDAGKRLIEYCQTNKLPFLSDVLRFVVGKVVLTSHE
jgi:hypothetical protein